MHAIGPFSPHLLGVQDSVANSTDGDVDMIFMHAKRRVSEGVYVCDEGDVFTLAGLQMQIDFGDHGMATEPMLKAKLGDYIPNHAKKMQRPREWLEDLLSVRFIATLHRKLSQACRF